MRVVAVLLLMAPHLGACADSVDPTLGTEQAFSLYGYLASLAVHEGGQVDERAELGTAGVSPTGDATVYFELRIDGRPVDPVEWLKQ